jgi:ribonuclease HII
MDLKYEKNLWRKNYNLIAGVDEAGRGPLAGPVVAAAVIFPRNLLLPGVDDSKKLNAEKRKILYRNIIENCITFGIGIISETVIDKINILNSTLLAMKQSIDKLNIKPDYILIDGNQFYDEKIPHQTIVKGDQKSFTIAAASIIAKVFRDYLMMEYSRMYPAYNFTRHKGYGTKEHVRIIDEIGWSDIHRKTFEIKSLKS